MSRPDAALLAAGSGLFAALLQFAGALKSVPGIDRLPVDLTALALLALLPSLFLLLLVRQWRVSAVLGPPLLGAGLLLFWLVLSGGWSRSAHVLAEKLPQIVLLGPPMLLAGLLVGADGPTRRRFALAVVGIALLVGTAVGWGLAQDRVVLGGEVGADPARTRVQYQLAGLAIACGGGVAAVRLVQAGRRGRLGWAAVLGALGLAVLLPGGRAALLAFGLGVAGPPALLLWLRGRPAAALGWVGLVAAAGGAALAALLLLLPQATADLATLDRLFGDPTDQMPARLILWGEALRWAGRTAPFGLGSGSFTIAAGTGDDRHLHPHNHALEALAEGGLPGLLLWLAAFGGGVALAMRQAGRVAPERAAVIAALTLPVGLTVMVSTDLGNRMAWFALGLLFSLAVEARRPDEASAAGPAHV
ncbi:O-antigen ligase family protein [Siccirubricoccus sp. KC 17139]|uniref:O-antigen ligase family protein n=1 Tax=Siccirubricoccus soli TaxID=2899147 RepID=A0ABT1CYL1_9PROT|nr:O-antigen ligase family protein [Siccirubricoccus soli]MCO6414753.1 O-antigen ligase family protein [Siccirubricoccus soli]MCP2680883.1 O-antigen ligase family protein [Siccirubricoccus soli]